MNKETRQFIWGLLIFGLGALCAFCSYGILDKQGWSLKIVLYFLSSFYTLYKGERLVVNSLKE